jgi:type III secretion protein L
MGLVVLIDRPGWTLAADAKVIEPEEVCAVAEAADLMRSAETYASRILRGAMKVFDARATDGFKQGERDAAGEMARRFAQVEAARATLLEALKPALVDLLLDALTRLAHGIDRQRLYAGALLALEDAWSHARWARLRVPPADVDKATDAVRELAGQGGTTLRVQVLADADVEPGGCRFESDLGCADAGLDVQLAALREAFQVGIAQWSDADVGETTEQPATAGAGA